MERLRLYEFRNYRHCALDLTPGLNLITGSNAQGKTNLLEAIATLALTRSPRPGGAADLIRWGAHQCAVEARVRRPGGETVMTIRFDLDARGRAVRGMSVDGKPRAARAMLGICPVVLFSPEDLQLVSGGPDARRRQLDMLLAQLDPLTAGELFAYRRALVQRNAALRTIADGAGGQSALAVFTRAMVVHGARIRRARTALVRELSGAAARSLREISGGLDPLSLRYLADGQYLEPAEGLAEGESRIDEALRRRSAEERARGMTLSGPHRDDVEICLDGRPARHTASQGQQRSMVLAYKLAEVGHLRAAAGCAPVLLLDDVFGELDRARREHLLSAIRAMGSLQLVVTATDASPFPTGAFPASRAFTVSAGVVGDGKIG
ncbi:MAG: DNA replication/repair protein RecF [Candidatus Dormibacteria bacterium]